MSNQEPSNVPHLELVADELLPKVLLVSLFLHHLCLPFFPIVDSGDGVHQSETIAETSAC